MIFYGKVGTVLNNLCLVHPSLTGAWTWSMLRIQFTYCMLSGCCIFARMQVPLGPSMPGITLWCMFPQSSFMAYALFQRRSCWNCPLFTLVCYDHLLMWTTCSSSLQMCQNYHIIFHLDRYTITLIGIGIMLVLLTVGDLPTIHGKINLSAVTSCLNEVGCVRSPFLLCCSFQQVFSSYLDKTIQGSFLPSEIVILHGKALLQASISECFQLVWRVLTSTFQLSSFCCHVRQYCASLMLLMRHQWQQPAALHPPSVTLLSRGGRPLMSVPEYPDLPNSSDEQTDPDTLLETKDRGIQVVIPTSSRAIPRECPVCNNDLPSGMALYRHLRSKHPDERPYTCYNCMHTFTNLRELSSHCSNHHQVRSVSYKHCQYHSTTKAKMWQYVCSYTKGVKCATCGKGFATITEMLQHQYLHDEREEFTFQDCDSVYYTRAALNIHCVGKYGPGYPCANCDAVFDMPMQRNRHQKCCIWKGWYLPLIDFFLHF